ncbi:methyltransferase domain-containing protein [Anaerolineales bacterium HSG24]|nr:methyltransferase domain-containing protein [Anaerolineales bacterium HSG24]
MLPEPVLKLIFSLLYYQMAWSYDVVAWFVSFGQWATWRRLVMPFLGQGKTLELAYGTGGLFTDLYRAGYVPIGIDLSPYMARITRQRLKRHMFPMTICQAKAQELPFPDGYFNNVVATFPTEYILQPETLAEIHRVLQSPTPESSGGQLIVILEGQLRGPGPIRYFVEWLYKITGQRDHPLPQPSQLLGADYFSARWQMAKQAGAVARILLAKKR